MKNPLGILVIGTLLVGCGSASEPSDPGTPGTDTTRSSGGAKGTGGKSGTGGSTPATSGTGGAAGGSSGGSATGGSTAGGAAGSGAGGSSSSEDAGAGAMGTADAGGDEAGPPATPTGTAPYGCTGCKQWFNGKDLTGWDTAPGAWEVKPGGVLASKGIAADLYTHEDLADYRIFFQIRHLPAMGGKDHQACTVLFGKRPANPTAPARGLGGAQFQPPNGYSWDYGVGGKFTSPAGKPKLNAGQWNQCEIVVKEAGSFRAACCAVGPTPCKSAEVLSWAGPGRKHPFDIMMHNPGLMDEYKEIWIERSPPVDELLSTK